MTNTTLTIPDMSCEHCERTVTRALTAVPGIHEVAVDLPGKRVRVTYDATMVNVERMKQVLAGEDYPVASIDPA